MSDSKIFDRYLEGEAPRDSETVSGLELEADYAPAGEGAEHPGVFPFTRGIHPEMFRKRLWTRRQQSGFGSPEESNARLIYLLRQGQTGLNVDFDVATKLGIDPDHPLGEGDVGLQGTSLATLDDMERLFEGIPLDKVSTTLIAQPPASAFVMAAYLLAARRRGVAPGALIGTIMNCAFTQLVGPTYEANTHFFPIEFTDRVGLDVMEYCAAEMGKWNIVNVNAYNIRDSGVDAIQEAGFALSVAIHHVEGLLRRGLDIDDFAPRIAFFTAVNIDFFEEIAKLRAMRRIWAKLMRGRFGAKNDRSCWFRTAVQTSALPLTAQQPQNNIVRAALQTLAGVLGGSQSIHTTSWDEAFALPSEASHALSLRTQAVIGYETNVVKTADPLGGSYFVEELTDRLEARITALMEDIQERGGYAQLFEERWIEEQVREARFRHADRMEAGDLPKVGVNCFVDEDEPEQAMQFFRMGRPTIEARIAYIEKYRAARDAGPLEKLLGAVREAAGGETNLMPSVIAAVEAGATMGEVSTAFREGIGYHLPY